MFYPHFNKKDCIRIAREKTRILTFFQNLTLSFLDLDPLIFPDQEKPQVLQVNSLPNLEILELPHFVHFFILGMWKDHFRARSGTLSRFITVDIKSDKPTFRWIFGFGFGI